MCYLFLNLENGAVPGSLNQIKEAFNYDDTRVGALGSILYFGISLGSLVAIFIMDKFSYKVILGMSFIGNAIGLFLFVILNQ